MKKVRLIERIRYGTRIFDIGEIGTVVAVNPPLTFKDSPIFDFYVKFDNHKPIGVFTTEVEEMKEDNKGK